MPYRSSQPINSIRKRSNEIRIEHSEARRLKARFFTRAKAVFLVRLFLGALLVLVVVNPYWQPKPTPFELFISIAWFLAVLASSIAAKKLLAHTNFGRWAMFVALNVDVAFFLYLLIRTGGLSSALMPLSPVYTILFVLLFPGALAALPPLLILPIVTIFSAVFHSNYPLHDQVFGLTLYSLLNGIVIFITNYSLAHEEEQNLKILRLKDRLRQFAVIEERNRLAREIHDGIGAAISGLIIQSEYLLGLAQGQPDLIKEILELKSAAEDAIDELRRALLMMKDQFEFLPQLKTCCDNFENRHKLNVVLNLNGKPDHLTHEQELGIFRILQESLNNVAKHANASSVNVKVSFLPKGLQMRIFDNGSGFNPKTIPKHHYGLLNMIQRAKQIGGSFEVTSKIGQGTSVELNLNRSFQANRDTL